MQAQRLVAGSPQKRDILEPRPVLRVPRYPLRDLVHDVRDHPNDARARGEQDQLPEEHAAVPLGEVLPVPEHHRGQVAGQLVFAQPTFPMGRDQHLTPVA